MHNTKIIASALCCITLLASCSTPRFIYPNKDTVFQKVSDKPLSNKKVIVLPFSDSRPAGEGEDALFYLALIPLCPYGYTEYDYPESARTFVTIQKFIFNPTEDLGEATAITMQHSNLFKTVSFSFDTQQNTDYFLTGEIHSLYYKGRIFRYGLSIFGEILYPLGAPVGTSLNEVSVTFKLEDKKHNVLWEYSSTKEDYMVQFLYYGAGKDCSFYSKLMNETLNEAILNLKTKINDNPELFK